MFSARSRAAPCCEGSGSASDAIRWTATGSGSPGRRPHQTPRRLPGVARYPIGRVRAGPCRWRRHRRRAPGGRRVPGRTAAPLGGAGARPGRERRLPEEADRRRETGHPPAAAPVRSRRPTGAAPRPAPPPVGAGRGVSAAGQLLGRGETPARLSSNWLPPAGGTTSALPPTPLAPRRTPPRISRPRPWSAPEGKRAARTSVPVTRALRRLSPRAGDSIWPELPPGVTRTAERRNSPASTPVCPPSVG